MTIYRAITVTLTLGVVFLFPEQALTAPVYHSPNHICLSSDGRIAYVVNHTNNSISIVDVPSRTSIAEIPVGSFPAHAVLSPDEQTLFVTSLYENVIHVMDLERKQVIRSIQAGYHPYGVAISPDGRELYAVNSLSNTVSIISIETGDTLFEVPVGRDPRFVTNVPNSTLIIVSNSLSRTITLVDVSSGRVIETRDLSRVNVLRDVTCSHDGRWAFVTHVVSHDEMITMQMERGWINANGFSILDLQKPGHYVTLLLDRPLAGAANPWGLALSSNDQKLYVSLAGVHEVAIVDVPKALDLVSNTRPAEVQRLSQDVEIVHKLNIARRVTSGGIGPRGLVLNEPSGELLVTNYFSNNISVLDAETGAVKAMISLGSTEELTLWRKGEMLVNDARLCFQQWFSCASCHMEDATIDALSWDLINDGTGNRKNAKSLHDAFDTPPAMWRGVRSDMDAAVAAGQRFLGNIPKPENHRALLAYFSAPRRAPNPYLNRHPEAVKRGKQVFIKARCSPCHPAPTFTDLKKHDLELANETDLMSRFVTPSLRECYRTGPYLHDGSAETLHDLFTRYNPNNLHGLTSNLSKKELDDLVEYLRGL